MARRQHGGLPLVVWVTLLTAIPILGLGILALREVKLNADISNAARDVAATVAEQAVAIDVLTPVQIERIGTVGVARLLELGLDPDEVIAAIEDDYLGISEANTPVLDRQIEAFLEVAAQHDFGDRPNLLPVVESAVDQIDRVRAGVGDGTVTVEAAQEAYDSMLSAADMFLRETSTAFQLAHPDIFDAQEEVRAQDLNRIVIRTASLETALITDIVIGTAELDLIALVTTQTVHDEALSLAAEQNINDEIDELEAERRQLEPLASIWMTNAPVTVDRLSVEPDLYNDFAALLVDRLEYLEAVEEFTIESGAQVVAEAVAESDRIEAKNRRTAFGLLVIALGVIILEAAIILSFARPLRRLRTHVERIGEGDLAVGPLPLVGPTDIRRVTGALNDMSDTLDSVDRELKGLASGPTATPQAAETPEDAPIPGAVGSSIRRSVDRLVALTDELRSSEERLRIESRHDALTQRLNRVGALWHLERRLADTDEPFAVMIVDLDGFKNVNDTIGQAIGDRMLCEVADRLDAVVGDHGIVARVGGDEFMITALNCRDEAPAIELGQRTIAAIEEPFHFNGYVLSVSASVGVRIAHQLDDAVTVVEQSDAAVYQAKRRGRRRVEMYDVDLQDAIERAAEIELALRQGVEAGELVLHLQPTLDIATGSFAGAEALVRWERPDVGLVQPQEFIGVAERSGQIIDVGRWVLREACRLIAEWKRRDPQCSMRLAVNVSGRHLVEADLVADVDAAIAATGADPRLLELELTESHLLEDIGRVRTVLSALRARGVAIAVDDFGTGYSSMTYLQRLPLDAVKIDKAFVDRATDEGFDAVVIESIVRIGSSLGLEIVAEGVETELQLNWLREHGVHRMQGHLIAHAMPVADAERLLFSDNDRRP